MSDCTTRPAGFARPSREAARLPLAGLLALATAGFITIVTEALPAGLLPLMGRDLRVSDALVGQLVTVYAAGSIVAAIPLVAATRGMRRRPLLLAALAGFVVANTATAASPYYAPVLVARCVAGVSAGLLWALLAGYASRMVDARQRGRAIAIAMLGAPVAMSVGIPLGTALGAALGWRATFAGVTALTLALIAWVRASLPDAPGRPSGERLPVARVLRMPGVLPVLAVMFAYVLAHNILYTYIAPFLASAGMGARIDATLFAFGAASFAGIGLTGVWIGNGLRRLALASIALFALASVLLGVASGSPAVVYASVAVWGLTFGGAATVFQTASANAAGEAADVAQSMIVTVWNLAIAAGDARAGGDGGPFRRFHGERIMRETNDKQQRGNVTQRHDTLAAPGGNRVTQAFERFAARVTQWAGSPVAFGVAVAITIGWLACGPLVHFSDAWQLVINTGTTIITFLMVFLLQRNQNRDSVALHLKLDELVAATKSASNRLIGIEDASEDELKRLAHAYLELALRARTLRETSGEPARRDADDDSDGDGDDAASEAQERPTPAD